MPGRKPARQVVGVGAGDDVGDAEPRGQRREDVDQLGLAEGAAVARVGPVALPGQLVGARELVAHPERGAERRGGPPLGRRAGSGERRWRRPPGRSRARGPRRRAPRRSRRRRRTRRARRAAARTARASGLESVVQRAHGGQVLTTAGSRRSPGRWHRRPRPAPRAVRPGRRRRAGRARRSPGSAARRSARWPPRRSPAGWGTPSWPRRPAAGRRLPRPSARAAAASSTGAARSTANGPECGAPEGGQVAADAERGAGVPRDGADVGAGRAGDGHVDVDQVGRGPVDPVHVEPVHGDRPGRQLHRLPRPDPVVRAPPVDLDRADRRGHLLQRAGLGGQRGADGVVVDRRGGRRRQDLALPVVGDRGLPEPDGRLVGLVVPPSSPSSRVAAPTPRISRPVAIGSRVPAWPTLRTDSTRRARATTSCDVMPGALSTSSRPGITSASGRRLLASTPHSLRSSVAGAPCDAHSRVVFGSSRAHCHRCRQPAITRHPPQTRPAAGR